MRPIVTTRALIAAVANGIATSQTPLAAGNLTLNGSLVVSGVAQLGQQRKVIVTSLGSSEVGKTFTITGTDSQGRTISEVLTGPGLGLVVQSVLDYSTVTSIAVSAATAGAISSGTNGVGVSGPIPLDIYVPNSRTTISLAFTGTANASVEFTNDDPFGDPALAMQGYTVPTPNPSPWFAHPAAGLAGATANVYAETDVPMRAVRLVTNSGAGSVKMVVTQQSTQ